MKKWTKELVLKVSKECKSLEEFKIKYKGAHWRAWKDGYINELKFPIAKDIWSVEKAFIEAKKYIDRKEFYKKSRGAYNFLYRNKLLAKATSHMEKRFVWNKRLAFSIAKKYKVRSIFRSKEKCCYQWLSANNFLDKATSHMKGEIVLFEKTDKKNFIKKLNKRKVKFKEEFRVSEKTLHKIDFLIEFNNKIYGVEYKSDKKWWNRKEIKEQVDFYQKKLNKKFKNIECLIVSPSGKYGVSDDDFLMKLNNLK